MLELEGQVFFKVQYQMQKLILELFKKNLIK